MTRNIPARLNLWISLGLIAVTLAVYWPVRNHDFTGLDDGDYVLENIHVRNGFTSANIAWAFTSVRYAVNWHPLTWLSHMLDCQLFGRGPMGPHLVNALFHALSTAVLFLALNRMTKAPWPSAFVAALFALHPLHVESVAWISERKDVLSGFFWMLTMFAYAAYVSRRTAWRYGLVLLSFAVGLMAKPMLVTLPFVLLLLDWWPLGRIGSKAESGQRKAEIGSAFAWLRSGKQKSDGIRRSEVRHGESVLRRIGGRKSDGSLGRISAPPGFLSYFRFPFSAFRFAANSGSSLPALIAEKIPMFVLSAFVSFLVLRAQGPFAVVGLSALPMWIRIQHSIAALMIYLQKTFWPTNLAIYYPFKSVWPQWTVLPSAGLLLAVVALVVWQARKRGWLAVGWFWFVGTLVPVIGLVQVGAQGRADRYMYIPLIGFFIAVVWQLAEFGRRNRTRRIVVGGFGALTLIACAWATERQLSYWKDDLTLFSHTAESAVDNAYAQDLGAEALAKRGFLSEAIRHWEIAIKMEPNLVSAQTDMAEALADKNRFAEAIDHFKKAVDLGPGYFEAQSELAWIYATRRDYLDPLAAVDLAEQANRTAGYDWPRYLDVLGAAYASAGRFNEAIASAEKARRIALDAGEKELPVEIERRIEGYKQGKPFVADD